ncbi:MarR family winged helix-turn-helix transcriptional regulator [Allobranchiibius sp. CTAmp26]|uniref:MarR family winged helix-turn-helix transcriptional regulator n=1 Tax=Allobranchiibius sp. CTAmp26 TaxID=2815214 RepID=UPI001AA1954A|nr:MarR family transcriptional regulator [Allobranchiibius sp. CTAmp26]MBO1755086.1 MarR family transcriptional regulator [Allobranchiibius sp. CTAmp26]
MTTEEAGLSELVLRTARVLRRAHREALEPYGLSPHQSRAMGVIVRSGAEDGDGLRLSDLAAQLGIAPRSATDVVDALEEHGLVERRPSEHDRRAVDLRLTPAGRALRRTLERARATVSDRHFASLTDAERATLARLLRSALEASDPAGPQA